MKHSKVDTSIQKHLFDLVHLIHIKMKEIVKDTDKGLSPMQILILRILVDEGEMSQAVLVQKIGRDKSQVTRLIQDLENKKLLIKVQNKNDRRSYMLKPIKDVQNKVSFFIQKEHEMVAEMLAGISTEDIQKLDVLLMQMQSNLKNNY